MSAYQKLAPPPPPPPPPPPRIPKVETDPDIKKYWGKIITVVGAEGLL